MDGKLAFVVGMGVGYVLGTRAGREKFEQLKSQAQSFWESPPVRDATAAVQLQAEKLIDDGKRAVTGKLEGLRPETAPPVTAVTPGVN